MKCPICELFARDLRFGTHELLDQHAHKFYGLSLDQLPDADSSDQIGADQPVGYLRTF